MTQLTNADLIAYLDSEDNEFGLDSVATHGFLTATVVGLPLQNWLSAFFEGNETTVSDDIKQGLINWREELLTQLKNEQPIELPFHSDESDEVDFSPESEISVWSVGFVDSMFANEAESWFSDEDTEDDVAMLTLPMMVLSGIDEDDETMQDIRSDEDLLAQMANNIEKNLTELFLLFHTGD